MQKVVIKVGTNLLTRADGSLNTEFIEQLARGISRLVLNEREIVLVTSGAVAAGRAELVFDQETISARQALAAVGQGILMEQYRRIFCTNGILVAQVLLQNQDFENLATLQNTHNTLRLLLSRKVLPIVNENDVTATDELKYMANDRLAARVANLVGADGLILLTDVPGLYDSDPHTNPDAKIIKTVSKKELVNVKAGGASKGGHGGMQTKLEAASISECPTWIAAGREKNVLAEIVLKGENPGTMVG